MSQVVFINLDPESAPDPRLAGRRLIEMESESILVTLLPKGTEEGRSTVFLFTLGEGTAIGLQLTAANLMNIAAAVRGRLLHTGELKE